MVHVTTKGVEFLTRLDVVSDVSFKEVQVHGVLADCDRKFSHIGETGVRTFVTRLGGSSGPWRAAKIG